MSLSREEKITCPKCGQEESCEIWESVNVTLHPALKPRVLSRELNRFTCSGCGFQSPVASNLLYHDMEQKLMLWVVPPTEDSGPAAVDIDDSMNDIVDDYTLRLLDGYNALLEKIRIFDDEQNDCFVELVKLVVESQTQGDGPRRMFYGGLRDGDDGERRLLFVELMNDGEPMEYAVPLEELKEMLWNRFPDEAFHPLNGGQWPVVDRRYALYCFEQLSGE